MTTTQARVLKVLSLGGQLTAAQLAREAERSERSVRAALTVLQRKGFLRARSGPHRDAWCLAPRGESYIATRSGRAAMDVTAC